MAGRAKPAQGKATKPHRLRRFALWCLLLVLLGAVGWTLYVVHEINVVAGEDQAQSADAIAVFGAAEYNGRPSPVYHSRLDHAVALYRKQIAPLIITLGGGGDRDSGKSEGGVGRDYLLANGVPLTDIVAETHSIDTSEQVTLLAGIARTRHLKHIVVVSDGTHLFRIRALCEDAGLSVWTSPRPALGHIGEGERRARYTHEVLSYSLLAMGVDSDAVHRWVAGRGDD